MRKSLKQIITAILAAAILITGVTPTGTMTANAAASDDDFTRFIPNSTITMKLGESKRFQLIGTDKDGKEQNATDMFTWTSSNESAVSVYKATGGNKAIGYFRLNVNGKGTAVITGTLNNAVTETKLSMTVKVSGSEMTAKQKKCKHTYKTTKKATCQRTGIKTCKKCKWQKTIAKVDHKYVKSTVSEVIVDASYYEIYCNKIDFSKGCTGINCKVCDEYDTKGLLSPHVCSMKFSQREYGTIQATEDAYEHHALSVHGGIGYDNRFEEVTHNEDRVVTMCTWCGKEK